MRLLSADGRNSAGRVFPAPLGAAAAQGIHRGETSNEIKALPASDVKHSKLCVSEVEWTTGYLTINCCCVLTLQLEAASVQNRAEYLSVRKCLVIGLFRSSQICMLH